MQGSTSQAPNRIAGLPTEVIWEILLKASPKDIVNYCLTSREANLICEDQSFWREKLWTDFGKQVQVEDVTWKEMYKSLTSVGEDNSPIAAGYRNYSIIDNQGNLYMAGEDATYVEPNKVIGFGGGRSEIKISKIPTKIPMDSKVISVSQMGGLIGALTENGIAHIWTLKTSRRFTVLAIIPNTLEKWTIEPVDTIGSSKNKVIKVVILDNDEYAVIMDDGSIRIYIQTYGRDLKCSDKYGKYINIMGSHGKYYALTTSGMIIGFHENLEGKLVTFSLINLPEPIKKLSTKDGSYAALSKSGNIYIWGNIAKPSNPTMIKYEEVIPASTNWGFPVYKVNLPQPISSIYMSSISVQSMSISSISLPSISIPSISEPSMVSISKTHPRLMAVSIYGKLYSLQEDKMDKPTEIDIGYRVKYVADGNSFTVAISTDRIVNYWDHK